MFLQVYGLGFFRLALNQEFFSKWLNSKILIEFFACEAWWNELAEKCKYKLNFREFRSHFVFQMHWLDIFCPGVNVQFSTSKVLKWVAFIAQEAWLSQDAKKCNYIIPFSVFRVIFPQNYRLNFFHRCIDRGCLNFVRFIESLAWFYLHRNLGWPKLPKLQTELISLGIQTSCLCFFFQILKRWFPICLENWW